MTRTLLFTILAATLHAESVSLAERGRALLPIVVSQHACAECAKIGSVSDRALLLANEVAEAVNAQKRHLQRADETWRRLISLSAA